MSHESASWVIEQNRLREERAKQAAWQLADACERSIEQFDVALAEAKRKHGAALTGLISQVPQRPNATASLSEVERYVSDLKACLRKSELQLSASVQALDVGARLAQLRPIDVGAATTSMKDSIQVRIDTVKRVVSRLPGDVSNEVRHAIQEIGASLVNATDVNVASNAEIALRAQVQRACEASLQREAERAAAVLRNERLRGLDGPEVLWAQAELAKVERGDRPLTPELMQRIGQIEAEATRYVDRQFATQVIKDAFVALGYSVEEGFETAFVEGGAVHLKHAELQEYAVEFEVDPSRDLFHAHLVREATEGLDPGDAAAFRKMRDTESEAKLCAHLREARKTMAANGVRVSIEKRVAPGTPDAVKIVEPRSAARKRYRATSAARAQAAPNRR